MKDRKLRQATLVAATLAAALTAAVGLPFGPIDFLGAQTYTFGGNKSQISTNAPGGVGTLGATYQVFVRVVADSGQAMGGATVNFQRIGSGSSSVSPASMTAASDGSATFNITDGVNEVQAYVATAITSAGAVTINPQIQIFWGGQATPVPDATATPGPTATPGVAVVGGTSTVNGNGSLSVAMGAVSPSTGVSVVGGSPQAFTGVADIPPNFTIPVAPPGGVAAPAIDPASLPAPAPLAITAQVNTSTGGVVIAGNIGIVLPPGSIAGIPGGQMFVTVKPNPQVVVPGGPAQFSPNGSIADISFTDLSNNPITTFPSLIPIVIKYNGADIAQSGNNPGILTAAYVIDANSPPLENPNGFPVGTFVIFPPQNVSLNQSTGTIMVTTQALGSAVTAITNPVGYVQTLKPTQLYSSFDPNNAQVFGTKPQFAYLKVVEPQVGLRLYVQDPDTGNFAYVNAADTGPSGPPPGR